MVVKGKPGEILRTMQAFQLSSQENGQVMGWPRGSAVWAEQSAPMRGHPGPAFRDSQCGALQRGRDVGFIHGKDLERWVQEGEAAMENRQMVAPVCQARPGPVTSDTGFLALMPQSLHLTAAPPPHQKRSASQQGPPRGWVQHSLLSPHLAAPVPPAAFNSADSSPFCKSSPP